MSLVIARGNSVLEYPRAKLVKCCKNMFTFAVNDSTWDFPHDVVVAGDPEWIKTNRARLLKDGKPIITRKWDCLAGLKLPLIELPNDVCDIARLSGMIAVKISDSLSLDLLEKSYVLGIDHTSGHYDDEIGNARSQSELKAYSDLACHNTLNLGGIFSEVKCWDFAYKLPKNKITVEQRLQATQHLKDCATKLMYLGIKDMP